MMSHLNSSEPVTTSSSQLSAVSSPSGSGNDVPSWNCLAAPAAQSDITKAANTRGLNNPAVAPSASHDSKGNGTAASQQPQEFGPSTAVDPTSGAASLPSRTSKNNPPSSPPLDARSYTKPVDNTASSLGWIELAPSSLPGPSTSLRPSPSPVPLRIDLASPPESTAPPAPPPKSPRHFPTSGRSFSSENVPPVPTLSMGSSQSKAGSSSSASAAPAHAPQPQRPYEQQRLQPQNVHGHLAPPGSTARAASSSAITHTSAPGAVRARSPSHQPSQTFTSRSYSPAPIITLNTSLAPSSTSNGQPGTATTMAASFGSGATKLMRKFAGRRKKSEDATTVFGRHGQDGGAVSQRPSQAQLGVADRSVREASRVQTIAPVSVGQAKSTSRQMTSPLSSAGLPSSTTKDKKAEETPNPTSSVSDSPSPLHPPSPQYMNHSNHNRTSLITLSPGISSAVDFMKGLPIQEKSATSAKDTMPREQRADPPPSASPVSSSVPLASAPGGTTSVPTSPEKEKEKDGERRASSEAKESWRKSDSTIGHHTIRQGANGNTRTSRPVSMAESFQSAYTVVPSGGPGSIGGGNKRWSTLTADMDFGVMVEEDGEEEAGFSQPRQPAPVSYGNTNVKTSPTPSVKQQNRRSISLNVGILGTGTPQVAPSFVHVSGKTHKGTDVVPLSYSISESSAVATSATKALYQRPRSPPVPSPTRRDPSNSTRALPHQPHAVHSHAGQSHSSIQTKTPQTGGTYPHLSTLQIDPRNRSNQSLHPEQQGSSSNLRGRLAAWATTPTGNPSRNSTLPPPSAMLPLPNSAQPYGSPRPTTVSITSSLAPAAGLAKRAAEKLGGFGKKWGLNTSSSGSGYSSSASSRDAGSHWSSQSQTDHGQGIPLGRTNSNQSSLASSLKSGNTSLSGGFGDIVHRVQLPVREKHKDRKNRRTPNAPSGAYSLSSSITSASTSESDAFFPSSGPMLGVLLRGPLMIDRNGDGAAGLVFGKDLKTVVSRTRAVISISEERDPGKPEGERERLVKAFEQRKLPALVTRCAQHLLMWGVQEEGLFRVSGRASHVSKLRSEFDTGVDYDMTSCTPGDLDPHAVASVFKAYLRELPESILTQRLHPLFEIALTREMEANPPGPAISTNITSTTAGLPSNPRATMNMPMRKPPSLSTLAMPSFNGMPPASETLIKSLRSLISRLPEENRDLILTVVQLMKATYQATRDTKMPLSNLLLVFCPSLNMSPPLLKALCETRDIWDPPSDTAVLDIKQESPVVDISADNGSDCPSSDMGYEEGDTEDFGGEDLSVQSVPSEQPSSEYHASVESASLPTKVDAAVRAGSLSDRPPVPTIYLDSRSHYSSSSLSSTQEIEIPSQESSFSSPPPLSSSAESVATPTSSSGHPSLSHLPIIDVKGSLSRKSSGTDLPQINEGTPLVVRVEDGRHSIPDLTINPNVPVQFPSSHPIAPSPQKRRSVALLSLPSFSPIPPQAHDIVLPESPGLRGKKPSLRRLFTKRSTASLRSNSSAVSHNAKSRASSIPLQHSPGAPYTPTTPRSATDSTVSTPVSAVTAPQSSTSLLPPVLDMQIDSGVSLAFDLGVDVSNSSDDLLSQDVSGTATTDGTFYASALSSQVSLLTSPVSAERDARSPYLRQRQGSTASTTSTASSNHLGLLEDAEDEDWMQAVLTAAGANKI